MYQFHHFQAGALQNRLQASCGVAAAMQKAARANTWGACGSACMPEAGISMCGCV
jgi:hypothetical protein